MLYSPERITVGGLYSVRGFKKNMLSGDSGGYWRNQVNWIKPIRFERHKAFQALVNEISIGVAYDVGVIENNYHGASSGRLSGKALELKLKGTNFSSSVTVAEAMDKPHAIKKEHPVYFWFEFNY